MKERIFYFSRLLEFSLGIRQNKALLNGPGITILDGTDDERYSGRDSLDVGGNTIELVLGLSS